MYTGMQYIILTIYTMHSIHAGEQVAVHPHHPLPPGQRPESHGERLPPGIRILRGTI